MVSHRWIAFGYLFWNLDRKVVCAPDTRPGPIPGADQVRTNHRGILRILGALGETRTHNLRLRRPLLYPVELQTQHVSGGGERDRTAGLDVANVALSQLSYTPCWRKR